MQKDDLIELMISLVVDALEEEGVEEPVQVNRDLTAAGFRGHSQFLWVLVSPHYRVSSRFSKKSTRST